MRVIAKTRGVAAALCVPLLSSPGVAEGPRGSEWAPTEMSTAAFPAEPDVFLRFEQDGRYFGNAGCNSMRGQFVTNEQAILFGPAATTKMACPEPVQQLENDFLQALMSLRGFARDSTRLTLSDAAGDMVLQLRQKDAD